MKHQLIIAVAIAFSIISCKKNNPFEKLDKASWLIGTWTSSFTENAYLEIWQKANDSAYYGHCFKIVNNEIAMEDVMGLKEVNGKLIYSARVPDQNGGEIVKFNLTSQTDNQIVFENPNHDFPTKIVYTKINNDSIVTEISGEIKGEIKKVDFRMKRKNNQN